MNNRYTTTPPDFAEGLSCLLSRIRAHMSSSIISPPMAHLLVCQDSRFTFSHEFSYLLVSQIEAHLDDKDIDFKLRNCKGKSKKKTYWSDSTVNDIVYRPDCLVEKGAYELLMNYERGYYNGSNNTKSLPFQDDHPGSDVIFLKQSKKVKIPIISASDGFHDIADLKMGDYNVSEQTNKIRETYARRALILFYPFRAKKHLLHADNTYWSKFHQEVFNGPTNKFFKEKGIEILLNIQALKSAQRLQRPVDLVACGTTCKPS